MRPRRLTKQLTKTGLDLRDGVSKIDDGQEVTAEQMFAMIDVDKDGAITFEEYKKMHDAIKSIIRSEHELEATLEAEKATALHGKQRANRRNRLLGCSLFIMAIFLVASTALNTLSQFHISELQKDVQVSASGEMLAKGSEDTAISTVIARRALNFSMIHSLAITDLSKLEQITYYDEETDATEMYAITGFTRTTSQTRLYTARGRDFNFTTETVSFQTPTGTRRRLSHQRGHPNQGAVIGSMSGGNSMASCTQGSPVDNVGPEVEPYFKGCLPVSVPEPNTNAKRRGSAAMAAYSLALTYDTTGSGTIVPATATEPLKVDLDNEYRRQKAQYGSAYVRRNRATIFANMKRSAEEERRQVRSFRSSYRASRNGRSMLEMDATPDEEDATPDEEDATADEEVEGRRRLDDYPECRPSTTVCSAWYEIAENAQAIFPPTVFTGMCYDRSFLAAQWQWCSNQGYRLSDYADADACTKLWFEQSSPPVSTSGCVLSAAAVNAAADTAGSRRRLTGPSGGGATCHPAHASVELASGERVRIDSVTVGTPIRTPSGFEPIVGFLHADKNVRSAYHVLSTDAHSIAISDHHFLFIDGVEADPATAAVGQMLSTPSGPETIRSITKRHHLGAYHLVTPSGAYYVDDVAASTYVSYIPHTAWKIFGDGYITIRYNLGLPFTPEGRCILPQFWMLDVLNALFVPAAVQSAVAWPLIVGSVVITEVIASIYDSLIEKAAMTIPSTILTGVAVAATLVAARK